MHGHGFIPRVTARNRAGVARALSPTDLFGGAPPPVSHVVVEAPDALADPSLVTGLQLPGRRIHVDTQAWRFGSASTWRTPKWAGVSYAPAQPYDGSQAWVADYLRRDLLAQAAAGATEYVLPAWLPEKGADVKAMLGTVVEQALSVVGSEVDAKPVLATLPCWLTALDPAFDAIGELRPWLSGVTVLVNKLRPMQNSVDQLADLAGLLLALEAADLPVVLSHGGAIAFVLRALGATGADAGLAEAETFDASAKTRSPASEKDDQEKEKDHRRPGPRVYVPAFGLSVTGARWRQLVTVPAVAAAAACNLRCCRFGGPTTQTQDHAVEHALTARVDEVQQVDALTRDMRIDKAVELVRQRLQRVRSANAALREAGIAPVPHQHLENQLALLQRFEVRQATG